jgi:aspartyl-tRNA(Asn)/glutamyl-tRNA(Gln) amidotransferase subunit A
MHRDYLDDLLPTLETRIAERLRWGASITPTELNFLRARHQQFRAAVARLFAEFDFLMLPSMPLTRLVAGEDFTAARPAILRYTSPFSLAGVPVVTLPGELLGAPFGTGIQLAAPALADATLLAYAASL